MENIGDRISQLPECIVHHILSYLKSPVDLVRIRVLSKTWFALAASLPILDFRLDRFTPLYYSGFKNRRQFFEYVAYTISKFCEQNVSVHTLKLIATVKEPTEVDIIKRWIGLIITKDVKVLELRICKFGGNLPTKPPPIYRLPNTLLTASSLTSLTISGCELPLSLMVDGVKFKSLKSLSLHDISIDEEVIKYLTTNCPILEEFIVEDCYGFKRFCVYGHQNLQKVKTFYGLGVERIDIEAPNLHYLALTHFQGAGAPCINLSSCKKLTTLYFRGKCSSISNWFAKFFSNFPLIENLFLDIRIPINLIKVSSVSLRKFRLHPWSNLEKFEIDAPNLLSFEDSGDSDLVPFPLVSTSGQLLKGCMQCYAKGAGVDWFYKLRQFLDKNNGFKVLKLHIGMIVLRDSYQKRIQSPLFELEHVELKFCSALYLFKDVVDVVLQFFRPQSLSLSPRLPLTDHKGWSHAVKYTYERLLQQEGQGQTCIQIGLSSASKAERHFSNLNVLLKALTHDRRGQTITFIKSKKKEVVPKSG